MMLVQSFAAMRSRASATSFLWGRKPSKIKRSVGNPELTSAGTKAVGPGECLYLDVFAATFARQEKSGVADAWGAGVGNQCYGLTRKQSVDDGAHGGVFVKLVVGCAWCVDAEMAQQHPEVRVSSA